MGYSFIPSLILSFETTPGSSDRLSSSFQSAGLASASHPVEALFGPEAPIFRSPDDQSENVV
jgi:hypothetical protein